MDATSKRGIKREIDWEKIESQYRAGILTLREMAADGGVSHAGIRKRAEKYGWSRDLAARIYAKADLLVSKMAIVSGAREIADDAAIVDANAEAILRIRLAHRGDIAKNRALAAELLSELETTTGNRALFEQLADLMAPEADPTDSAAVKERARRQREIWDKALSLGGRTDTMRKLADTLKILIGLEREAYGLTVSAAPESSYEETLKALRTARAAPAQA
jgi:hypothetical protein